MRKTTKTVAAVALGITAMLSVAVVEVAVADAAVAGPKPCC